MGTCMSTPPSRTPPPIHQKEKSESSPPTPRRPLSEIVDEFVWYRVLDRIHNREKSPTQIYVSSVPTTHKYGTGTS